MLRYFYRSALIHIDYLGKRPLTAGFSSKWHLLCFYNRILEGWDYQVDSYPYHIPGPISLNRGHHRQQGGCVAADEVSSAKMESPAMGDIRM